MNYFCTEQKYFLFDVEVSADVVDIFESLDMSWFELSGKTYKEAWGSCPVELLTMLSEISEFQTDEAVRKFKEITGLDLP